MSTQSRRYPAAPLYDEDTRHGSIADMQAAEAQAQAQIIEEGELLLSMTQTRGWKLFEDSLREQIATAKEVLVDINDPIIITKQQILCRALSNVLGTVYSKISEANALRSTDPVEDLAG